MKKKALIVLSLVGILGIMAPTMNTEAAWKTNSVGRYYTANNAKGYLTGWKNIGKYKYYFAKDGYAATGWKYISKNWYFFDIKGRMVKNKWVDGFYLSASGKMAKNTTIDGIQLDKTGNKVNTDTDTDIPTDTAPVKPVSTWVEDEGQKYYYDYTGKLSKGFLTIKDKIYYMDPKTGAMKTGVVKIKKKYYYFDVSTGVQKTGWVTISKYTYYFNPTTAKVTTGRKKIDKYYYYFDKKGRMQTKKWVSGRYYEANGRMAKKKWIETKYVNASGLVTQTRTLGFYKNNGNTYYLDDNYKLIKNKWYEIDGKWYNFDKKGILQKSKWIDEVYYVNKNGVRIANKFAAINKSYYLFDINGKVVKGLTVYKNKTYYLDPETGVRKTGFVLIDGIAYYFQPDKSGAMAVDVTLSVDGVIYDFDGAGIATYKAIDTSKGQAIADYALKFVGYPYLYGGATNLTKGVDCSGFTMLVHKYFGINIPRVAGAQALGTSAHGGPFAKMKVISESELLPGDIICYYSPVGHVGIYIGNGKIVHASNSKPYPSGGIKISAYNYSKITKIVRYW